MKKRIYLNNGAWTQAVEFDPDAPGDIIVLTSPAGAVQDAVQDFVEVTGLEPGDPIVHARIPITSIACDQRHIRALAKLDEGASEKYLRDLMGDDAYEAWDNE
jgi:hypothetical protein